VGGDPSENPSNDLGEQTISADLGDFNEFEGHCIDVIQFLVSCG
jgi:hypothetical protein